MFSKPWLHSVCCESAVGMNIFSLNWELLMAMEPYVPDHGGG